MFIALSNQLITLQIDFTLQVVSTIAGTGEMLDGKIGGGRWTDQALSSPWDLEFGGPNQNILYIAMAGTHTLWGLFLEDGKWQKGM